MGSYDRADAREDPMEALKLAGLSVRREDRSGQAILRLEGRFDASAAELLRRIVEQSPGRILLDFSRVRDFRDVAVPALTRGLEARQVRLVGLPKHQERLFGYFGWRERVAGSDVYYVPERLADV